VCEEKILGVQATPRSNQIKRGLLIFASYGTVEHLISRLLSYSPWSILMEDPPPGSNRREGHIQSATHSDTELTLPESCTRYASSGQQFSGRDKPN
jgi:hypothetical protein